MERDFTTFTKYEQIEKERQEILFNKEKATAFKIAMECPEEKGKQTLLNRWKKMRFIFNREHLLSYGYCKKLNKSISFLPNQCQLETQNCFEHRK